MFCSGETADSLSCRDDMRVVSTHTMVSVFCGDTIKGVSIVSIADSGMRGDVRSEGWACHIATDPATRKVVARWSIGMPSAGTIPSASRTNASVWRGKDDPRHAPVMKSKIEES